MRQRSPLRKGRIWLCVLGGSIVLISLSAALVLSNLKKHDFAGKCQICHNAIPQKGTPFEEVILSDRVESLCEQCHNMTSSMSHPVNIAPKASIPLGRYLDKQGKLTCLTCHDVHKEDNADLSQQELKGLIRGHTIGRAFCSVCHNEQALGVNWRHSLAVTFAHTPGELIQSQSGSLLDRHSVECLSCHDGVISIVSMPSIRSGEFRHRFGFSHPVGTRYPAAGEKRDYMMPEFLPNELKLFNGAVGCLTCHDPYGGRNNLLVMDNRGSRLCLSCHKK